MPSEELQRTEIQSVKIHQLRNGEFQSINNLTVTIGQLATDQFKNTQLTDLQMA
jgi:hypothetical protein